jgi:hypothetical protein
VNYNDFALSALAAYAHANSTRTAEGEGILHVFRNRGADPRTLASGLSFPAGWVVPQPDDFRFVRLLVAVDQIFAGMRDDPTNGATHWVLRGADANGGTECARIGALAFFRTIGPSNEVTQSKQSL